MSLTDTNPTDTAADDTETPSPAPLAKTDRVLPGQLVDVHFDTDSFRVRVTNRDRIAYEKTAPRHKWQPMGDAPNFAMTYMTWSAAKRDGQTELTFDQWQAELADYDIVRDDVTFPTQ